MAKELKRLKQAQHRPDQQSDCSWQYFAGFFDAECSITVSAAYTGLRLEARQTNPWILVQILCSLHGNHLGGWKLYHKDSASLSCLTLKQCIQTLELLLANGLLVKRKQVELALGLTPQNHLWTPDAIFRLNGWQKRYRRLDKGGVTRAANIQKLQARLHHHTGSALGGPLQSQLATLQSEHAWRNLVSRCTLLRKDLRQALREGGQVAPPSSP